MSHAENICFLPQALADQEGQRALGCLVSL